MISPYPPIQKIVGYAGVDLTSGDAGRITLVTPQFKSVGEGQTFNINEMSCPADACNQILMYELYPNGTMKETYYWSEGDNGPEWEDSGYNPIPDKTFKCGTAFWLQSDTEGNILQSSGEVNKEDVETELNCTDNGRVTLVGNTYPVPVYIQDILCPATHTDQILMYRLFPNGTMKETFYWSEDAEPEWEDSGYNRADVTFAPGETFWVQCDVPGATITFPGVELK